jgi:hypothetical protein
MHSNEIAHLQPYSAAQLHDQSDYTISITVEKR